MGTTARATSAAGLLAAALLTSGCAGTEGTAATPLSPGSTAPPSRGTAVPSAGTGLPSAGTGLPSGRTTPPSTGGGPPTMRPPAKPPKTPTDLVPHDVVAGRVTRGGSGPCYRLVTDDDVVYALYSTAGTALAEGTYIRIRFGPLTTDVDCGRGRPVALLEVTVLG